MSEPGEGLGQRELRELLDGLPHPMWVCAATGRLLFVNRAFEAAFGDAAPDSLAAGFLGGPPAGAADGSCTREARVVLDGVETCWLIAQWPLHGAVAAHGAVLAGIATDITRQHQAQRQLHGRPACPPAA